MDIEAAAVGSQRRPLPTTLFVRGLDKRSSRPWKFLAQPGQKIPGRNIQ